MADATVTRYELAFGAKDTVTGWYEKDYSTTYSIDGSIQNRGFAFPVAGGVFDLAKYDLTFFTADTIAEGDLVKDYNSDYYLVKAVQRYDWLNEFSHYQCALEKRTPFAVRPSTSGTWHLDSDSAKTDPRYRHKLWLETYVSGANLLLDDGVSGADVDYCFAGMDYPLYRVFVDEDEDGLFIINESEGTMLYDAFGYPYAEVVSVPVTCCAVNKSGLTAANLVEQMKEEVKHVASDHPLGSRRSVSSTRTQWRDIGGDVKLWESTVTIRYKRFNDNYVPTYPRITYGASGSPDGTFYFPNCTRIEWPNGAPDINLLPPGRVGNVIQIMGGNSWKVRLYCDLDLDNTTYTWKRPQTSTPKTDRRDDQVFWEIMHQASIIAGDEPYQTLTFGANGPSFKVRLESMNTVDVGDGCTLMLEFEEYVTADLSGSTYSSRFTYS